MIVVDIQTRQAAEYLVHSLDAFEQQKAIKEGMLRAAFRAGGAVISGRV